MGPGSYTGMVITGTIIFRTVKPMREITDETIFNFVHFMEAMKIKLIMNAIKK